MGQLTEIQNAETAFIFPKYILKQLQGWRLKQAPGYHCGGADACPGISAFSSSPPGVQLHRATTALWSLTQRTPSPALGTRSTHLSPETAVSMLRTFSGHLIPVRLMFTLSPFTQSFNNLRFALTFKTTGQ